MFPVPPPAEERSYGVSESNDVVSAKIAVARQARASFLLNSVLLGCLHNHHVCNKTQIAPTRRTVSSNAF